MPMTPTFPPCKPIVANSRAKRWSYTEEQFFELYRIAYFSEPKDRKTLLTTYNMSMNELSMKVGVTPVNTDIDATCTMNMRIAA